ncbi:MAG: hypothetical protein AAF985_19810 [Bacteroidota bacterium]
MPSPSNPNFTSFGDKLFSGKLAAVSTEDLPKPSYFGFVQIQGMPNHRFLYFRDYEIVDGQPVFKDLDLTGLEDRTFFFNFCYLRIPPEFKYLWLDDNKTPQVLVQTWPGGEPDEDNIRYYGLALLNVHLPIQRKLTLTDSMTLRSYIKPDYHYTSEAAGVVGGIKVGGREGCLPTTSFGLDKVPLFGMLDGNNNIFSFYMLSITTESTASFCQFNNAAELSDFLTDLEDKLTNERYLENYERGERLGIYLCNPSKYDVTSFDSRYGVHIVAGGACSDVPDEKSWKLDWYDETRY